MYKFPEILEKDKVNSSALDTRAAEEISGLKTDGISTSNWIPLIFSSLTSSIFNVLDTPLSEIASVNFR